MSAGALSSGNHLEEKLKERMQASLVDLLPEETIDAFVKKAVKDFTEDRLESAGYNQTKTVKSPLRELTEKLVFAALQERFIAAFEKRLDDAIPQTLAETDFQTAADRAVAALGPQLLNGILSAMLVPMFNGLQTDILNRIRMSVTSGQLAHVGLPPF